MKKELKRYIICYIIFSIIGTLMHFAYDVLGSNVILNSIVPVNESVWEHMKLIFYPALFFFVYNYDYKRKNNMSTYYSSFIISVTFSIITCILSYYIYSKFIGNTLIIDIISYYVCMGIVFLIMYLMNYIFDEINEDIEILCEIIILTYIFIFIIYTYFPPNLIIFNSP